jgi:hypothetical protein
MNRIMGAGGRRPAGRPIFAGTNNLSIGGLTANPNFDFINNINSNSNDDHGSLNFFDDNVDSPYNPNSFNCSYVDINTLCNSNNHPKNLSFMSLNIQSLPAKYSELKDLLDFTASTNFLPDIILLQEIWHVPDDGIIINHYFSNVEQRGGGGGGVYMSKTVLKPQSILTVYFLNGFLNLF